MSERADVVILGGGIIGTGLAAALARRGVSGIRVVDLDLAGLYASSELNAGGVRATWWQPVNIETCRATLDFFRDHAGELGFRQNGYLWLYADRGLYAQALEKRPLQNAAGLGIEALSTGELLERWPLIDRHTGELVGATFSPRDGLVNPNAVRAFYREEAESRGVVFRNRHYVSGVSTRLSAGAAGRLRRIEGIDVLEVEKGDPTDGEGALLQILTTHGVPRGAIRSEVRLECDTVVNCLGAWSPLFAAKLGLSDPTQPVRRQIALVDVQERDRPPGVDFDSLGMIVDASGIYFHPEGPYVLAGFSIHDEAPGYDFEYDGDAFFESEVWPRLAHRASAFERCGHVRGWAGLYAVTPDRSGIAGPVAGFANLYEAHSFTGRGVMQSYGITESLAAHITTGRYAPCDLTPLSRSRFPDPSRWAMEDLHI